MTDTLSDKLRQMVARSDDELEALWEAADRIEELEAALREYVATVVDAEGVAFIDRMPTAELRLLVESAFRQEKPFEDRWDNA